MADHPLHGESSHGGQSPAAYESTVAGEEGANRYRPAPAVGRLGNILLNAGVITREQLKASLALNRETGVFFGQTLVDLGFVAEATLTTFLAKQCRTPHLSLLEYEIDPAVFALLPSDLCTRHRLLPIDLLGKNLTIAMVNPLDLEALQAVREACPEFRLKPILCTNKHFEMVLARLEETAGKDSAPKPAPDASDEQQTPPMEQASAPAQKEPAVPPTAAPATPSLLDGDPRTTIRSQREPSALKPPAVTNRVCLVCLHGWEIGREVELTKDTHLLGRAAHADTCLNSQLVSREHAKIVHNEGGVGNQYVIMDLGSSNGTYVNSVRVSSTGLRDGDKIVVGDILFKFQIQDAAEARFHKNIHRLIHYNQLTGLLTVEAFQRKLETVLQASGESRTHTLAMTDLDGLKTVNDTYGHVAGSIVLSEMGDIIRQVLRPGDVSGIYGGDEGIMLFPDTPIDAAYALAEDIRRTIASHVFKHRDQTFQVTISQGLAEWPTHGETSEELIVAADNALYRAKSEGRNQVCIASQPAQDSK